MRDMTVGPAQGHLWRYALPILLGNWMQLAYNAVDSMIAGRFIGKEALAAEGIAAPGMNLMILAVNGLCFGAKTPLKFLAFSAVLNAVLDLIFLGGFGFGIVCSAVTTVAAEACSAVLAAGYLVCKTKALCPTRQQWRIERKMLGKPERIHKGFFAGLRLEVCYWILIGTVTFFFREPIVSLFVAGA